MIAASVMGRRDKKRRFEDEEIESDVELSPEDISSIASPSESDVNSDEESDVNSDTVDETVEEQRLKLAKQYLSQAGLGIVPEDEVRNLVEQEAARATKNVFYNVAEELRANNYNFAQNRAHKRPPTCIAVSTDAVYTCGRDRAIIQWKPDSAGMTKVIVNKGTTDPPDLAKPEGHCRAVLTMSCSGQTLVSGGDEGVLKIWDTRDMRKPMRQTLAHKGPITGIRIDPVDSTRVYSTGKDMALRSWNLGLLNRPVEFFGHTSPATNMDVLVHGRPITSGEDGTIRVWKLDRESHVIYDYGEPVPVDVVAQLDKIHYVSGNQQGKVCVWSVGRKRAVAEAIHGTTGSWVTAIGCLRYSDLFFTGSDDGFVRAWKFADKELLEVNRIPIQGVINDLEVTEDGKFLYGIAGTHHRLGQ